MKKNDVIADVILPTPENIPRGELRSLSAGLRNSAPLRIFRNSMYP